MKDKEARHILGVIIDMHYIDGDLEERTWKLMRNKLGFPVDEVDRYLHKP